MVTRIRTILAALVAATALVSCTQESPDVTGRLDDLENRVAKLEKLVGEMNGNISSLQALVYGASGTAQLTVCVLDTSARLIPDISRTVPIAI